MTVFLASTGDHHATSSHLISLCRKCWTGRGSSSPRDGCFKCGGNHFQRDCTIYSRRTPQRVRQEKQTEQVMVQEWLAKETVKKVWEMENPKEKPEVPRVPKVRTRVRKSSKNWFVWS